MRSAIFLLFCYLLLGNTGSMAHAACCTHVQPRVPVRIVDEKRAGRLAADNPVQLQRTSDFSCDDDFVANDDNDNEEAPHFHTRRFRGLPRTKCCYYYTQAATIISRQCLNNRVKSLDASEQCILQSVFRI